MIYMMEVILPDVLRQCDEIVFCLSKSHCNVTVVFTLFTAPALTELQTLHRTGRYQPWPAPNTEHATLPHCGERPWTKLLVLVVLVVVLVVVVVLLVLHSVSVARLCYPGVPSVLLGLDLVVILAAGSQSSRLVLTISWALTHHTPDSTLHYRGTCEGGPEGGRREIKYTVNIYNTGLL